MLLSLTDPLVFTFPAVRTASWQSWWPNCTFWESPGMAANICACNRFPGQLADGRCFGVFDRTCDFKGYLNGFSRVNVTSLSTGEFVRDKFLQSIFRFSWGLSIARFRLKNIYSNSSLRHSPVLHPKDTIVG